MAYEIKGTIIKIGDIQQVTEKLSKREVVIETADNPRYPQSIPVELVNDRTSLVDGMSAGDSVRAEVDIRGRAWTKPGSETKYFLSLNVYKLERIGASANKGGQHEPAPSSPDAQDSIPF
jgi:single-strand DNA-binding protein